MDDPYELVEPRADSLIESLRSFGYTPETSIADLIDNSISAGARNVWVEFFWDGSDSWVSILDDGRGMTAGELREAMRAGSSHPLAQRDARDLGRFGLGLKTASFAQCRNLTVVSKSDGNSTATRRWDLDYVNETAQWRLRTDASAIVDDLRTRLDGLESGTLVVWERLDRIVPANTRPDSRVAQALFLEKVSRIEDHLAMVFHDYMTGRGRLRIHVNGNQLEPWDPFLQDHPATQILSEEALHVFGTAISVVPYVLPHKSRLTAERHDHAAGPKGWNAQQGFYIYRNRRMLVAGSWLNFFRQEEHYKLARIRVDIPNSMDAEWEIDVRKAQARPPDAILDDLKRIARITRERASEVYRFRGEVQKRRAGPTVGLVWSSARTNDALAYRIDRRHPLVKQVLATAEDRRAAEALLRLIEETVPVQQIWIDAAEEPEGQAAPFQGAAESEVRELLDAMFEAMIQHGYRIPEALDHLTSMDPFRSYPGVLDDLRAEVT